MNTAQTIFTIISFFVFFFLGMIWKPSSNSNMFMKFFLCFMAIFAMVLMKLA